MTRCTRLLKYPDRWTFPVHWSQNSPLYRFCTWEMTGRGLRDTDFGHFRYFFFLQISRSGRSHTWECRRRDFGGFRGCVNLTRVKLALIEPFLAYLRDLTHSFALCDRDMLRIVGKWYRCAFCAKDLCADCEAIDTHDNTHVFLVFKAAVDMQAFRCAVPHLFRISSLMVSCSLPADISLIWKAQMVVHLYYAEISTFHDMTMTNVTHDFCFVCQCYICNRPFSPTHLCRGLIRMGKVMY
jgi:hypothetical protein